MTRKVERVAIVGRDAAAWIAALGLQRALGASALAIEVIELPSLLRPVDAYAAVPAIAGLHKLLGIGEAEILSACAAVPISAQRFSNWGKARLPFLHGYDSQPHPTGDLAFLHYWVKARAQGLQVAFEDFSLAAAAAKQSRLPLPDVPPGGLAAAVGYHLDASAYAALVRKHALRAGVPARRARTVRAERDGDRIAAVLLDGSERIEADLFVDATGPEALLIGGETANSAESWRRWLPANRILAASAPRLETLPSFSQISAFRAGWVGLFPLQDRTAVTVAWDSDEMSEGELVQALPALAGMPIHGDAFVTPFHAGIRRAPWVGNCVAVGEAAIALEPLDAVQLHLVHIGVSHLVTLFPVTAERFPEAAPYNDAIVAHAENIRDFQIAHYRLNQRFDDRMWDRAREADGPASLEAKLGLFASRGEVIGYDHESFEEQNWSSIFVGHGLIPRSYDRRIDRVPQQEHLARVQQRLRMIAGQVNAMPSVEEHLASGAGAFRRGA